MSIFDLFDAPPTSTTPFVNPPAPRETTVLTYYSAPPRCDNIIVHPDEVTERSKLTLRSTSPDLHLLRSRGIEDRALPLLVPKALSAFSASFFEPVRTQIKTPHAVLNARTDGFFQPRYVEKTLSPVNVFLYIPESMRIYGFKDVAAAVDHDRVSEVLVAANTVYQIYLREQCHRKKVPFTLVQTDDPDFCRYTSLCDVGGIRC